MEAIDFGKNEIDISIHSYGRLRRLQWYLSASDNDGPSAYLFILGIDGNFNQDAIQVIYSN